MPPLTSPVQGGVLLERLHGDVLLHQAVEEDGEWGEADVVQSQVGGVVQRLQRDNKQYRGHQKSGKEKTFLKS